MPNLKSIRSKIPSKRALLAIGGVVAIAGGALASTDTLAASTDAANANVSQIASENFFPTPLPGDISCKRVYDGLAVKTGANFSWPTVPGMKYKVLVLRDNNPNSVRTSFFTTDTSYRYVASGAGSDRVRVYSVNIASGSTDANRAVSSGFVSWSTYASSGSYTDCSSKFLDAPNETWEDQSAWAPASRSRMGEKGVSGEPANAPSKSPAPSSAPQSSAAPSSEAPQPSEPHGSEAPSSTAPSSETTPPTTTTEAPAKTTFGVRIEGTERSVVIYSDGNEVCSAPLEDGFSPSSDGTNVVVSDGNSVKKVDPSTCALS
ncbi:hypothetical protein [Gordonia sp. (in: high G+C Gram-positive bacteria)]|uniref:hypothetical protein n=1 Tax=Gordonia sp. (in: high G+C Gram-positive bacteria) TaxID=84139 RepID=UPI003C76802F